MFQRFILAAMSSSSDKRNRSTGGADGGGKRSGDWTYQTNETASDSYFDKTTADTLNLHGLTIRDITDRHVENFLTGIEHELVEKLMTTFTTQSTAITNGMQKEVTELERKHEKEQNAFEDELQKLKDELLQNAVELEDFIAND